ncbi:ATP-binding protein [Paracoccus liaowanqingii]|uniref:ATP-binding protein n=1 Tax=Paracoccus liaowanqingii TaxID=2560053 RepID=A0A4V1BJ62_9RHOB|nr:AAA family ATPase [Paracoccus liaowanqingii]QBX35182.1 ATP-binding protein [Paracoccus liaowanqingii]
MAGRAKLSREDLATLHLHLWLSALNRSLAAGLRRRTVGIEALRAMASPAGTLAPHHADALLSGIEHRIRNGTDPLPEIALSPPESEAEAEMLRDDPLPPPLERLSRDAGLSAFERAALLICAAPEIAPDYRRLYGYVLDDLARNSPSVEVVLTLAGGTGARDGSCRRRLGPGGALRRLGLLVADDPVATAMKTRLEPAPGLTEWLLGALPAPPVSLNDPRMILPGAVADEARRAALGPAIRCLATADNALVGLWGPEPGRHDDILADFASSIVRPVFRGDLGGEGSDWAARLREQAAIAAGAEAILWLETQALPPFGAQGRPLAEALARLPLRIVLSGRTPWRPAILIGNRPYADILLPVTEGPTAWPLPTDALPPDAAAALDARYRLGLRERRAAVQVALSERRNRTNGSVPDLLPALARAARLVATPAHLPSVILVEPRRDLSDLVAPEDLHRQITEIAALYAHAPMVDGAWGFGRLTGSSGALKALFTGDPGTGKTMAAEVIAGTAGVALMKVDLSQVVSKWVGETEKNLEAVFDHAEQSRAALFFDEADALFGRRGEVRHGTDRYANLEVSYLLQRLEAFSGGLVILASNQRDEIDPAFIRRFQIALNFPRPGRDERLRLWHLAFARAPLGSDVDLAAAAAFDLTGGAIMTAARMAALLAAGDGSERIAQEHLAAATERQFRKEARLMDASQPDGLSVARTRI